MVTHDPVLRSDEVILLKNTYKKLEAEENRNMPPVFAYSIVVEKRCLSCVRIYFPKHR